jgi:hypothetical protein
MKDHWPPNATDEEKSLRLFKDALMKHAAAVMDETLEPEGTAAERGRASYEVENAYARVREHTPPELEGNDAPTYAEVLAALRKRKGSKLRNRTLPSRRVLVHMLVGLDYYFYKLTSGYERVYDMPHLTDEERAAENGLRHDLLIKLYEELAPAFDVSLSWPPSGR